MAESGGRDVIFGWVVWGVVWGLWLGGVVWCVECDVWCVVVGLFRLCSNCCVKAQPLY